MISRRALLVSSAAIGAAAFATTLPGLRAAAQPLPRRRSLKDMDLDDPLLETLREFVTMMKDPSRNGQNVSWVGFSDIHGTTAGFNKCPHGNWYFLPWHRGYVLMYELAARALTGNAEFAMPYWDWTEQPDFPAAFGDEDFDGQPNPLFVAGRLLTTGGEIPLNVSGPAVLDQIYAMQTLEEFGSSRAFGQDSTDPSWIMESGTQGLLESNPHNRVHCLVRGPFMCSGTSPQDPIFMMHHCNIDRIWDEWNFRGNPNSPDPLWLDMAFTQHFYQPDGTLQSYAVNQLLEVEPLGYTYREVAPPPPPPPPVYDPARSLYLASLYGAPLGLEAAVANRAVGGRDATASPDNPLTVSLDASGLNIARAIEPAVEAALKNAGAPMPQVYAFIRRMEPANQESTILRVFVNLPEARAGTPTEDNPNYVTTIGFFGPGGEHAGHGMRPSVAVDLTRALQRLTASGGLPSDEITIQLVPEPNAQGDMAAPVGMAEVELAVV